MKHKKVTDKMAYVRDKTHDGVDKVMDTVESIRDGGKEKIDDVKKTVVDARKNVDGYIKKNPEKSVLIAAGTGVVLGAVAVAGVMLHNKNAETKVIDAKDNTETKASD
jgi:ElaB/YqjD/DUF883 family membrane-anchored ribosome-binding protein